MSGLRVLDLFSGIGGFSLGLERAGMQTIAFCEIDPKARLVLAKHWPNVPIYEDVTTLKGEHIEADVICGGFPCQDISVAGQGAGLAGARSGLWFQFHRLINEIRPRYAIIENVSALRSRGLDTVLGSLAAIGYDAEWHCIPASAVGAPHQRDRVWVVAYPQLHGCPGAPVARGVAETIRKEPQRPLNTFNLARAGGVPAARADVPDAASVRPSGSGQLEQPQHSTALVTGQAIESQHGCVAGLWSAEPAVGRVADGVPDRVDRLKQLGNAVVPQIPELIGRAIMATLPQDLFGQPIC